MWFTETWRKQQGPEQRKHLFSGGGVMSPLSPPRVSVCGLSHYLCHSSQFYAGLRWVSGTGSLWSGSAGPLLGILFLDPPGPPDPHGQTGPPAEISMS